MLSLDSVSRNITWVSISQLQKEQLCWKPFPTFHEGIGPTCRSKPREEALLPAAPGSTARTTHCFTGTTNSPRGTHCSPYPQSRSTPSTPWAAPPTSPTVKCHFLYVLWATCSFTAVHSHGATRVNNSPATQKARLALVFLTIYSSGSRNRLQRLSWNLNIKVLTSHFPTILLENIALCCCGCSPHLPTHTQ